MATAMLSIHNSGPGTPKEIFCQSQIGNEEQECDEGFTGDPIAANTIYRDTLAAANAVAADQLDCEVVDFNPPTLTGQIEALGLLSNNDIYAGGNFTGGGGVPAHMARLVAASGALSAGFDSVLNNQCDALLVVPASNRVMIVGRFTTLDGVAYSRAVLVEANGSPVAGFTNIQFNAEVNGVARQSDGKFIFTGLFTTAWGNSHPSIARANADGTEDATFTATLNGSNRWRCATQADDKILIFGSAAIIALNGTTFRNGLGRFNPDGTVDAAFNPNISTSVAAVIPLASGKIFAAGSISFINGVVVNDLVVRLHADGTRDLSFASPEDISAAGALALQSDGKLLVGGGQFAGQGGPHNYLLRLNTDGTWDSSFQPVLNNIVRAVVVQVLGGTDYILCGGAFHVPATLVARFNLDGSLA